MNKIYKIVWSRTKHCYIVASEFAKGHTNSSVNKNKNMVKLGVSLALMAVLGSVGTEHPVQAATQQGPNAEAKGTQAVALGDNAKATANQAIAIGGSDATLNNNFTRAVGNQSIAIGGNVRVGGYGTIGIGGDDLDTFAGATDYNQFGYNNWVAGKGNYTNYNAKPEYGNGDGAVFVGVRSIGSGHGAVALGALSQASKNVATALGMGATADKVGSVALGTASHTTKDAVQVSNVAIKGTTYSFAGSITSKPGAVVSVGNNTVQRQIINVAPGAVSATSTDAINGSQLYAVANNITKTNVAVGSNNLTLAVNDTTNANGTIAYTVDLSQTAKTAIADVSTIKTNLASTAAVANQAKTDAATAQRTANTAVTNASTAQTTANAASTAAANVKITAEAASTAAAGATSKAEAASTVAATASNTATQAKTTADTAATNANAAKKDASDAKQAANTANTNANTALQTANTANTNANTALTKANTAVQTINVGTSANSGTVALNNTNNRLNLVGVGSVTTAVSGTNAINIGLTSSAESAIKAVPSISTAVTRIDSTVGSLSTTVGTVSSAVSGLNTTMNNISTAVTNAAGAVQEFTIGANKDGKTGGFKLNKTNSRADFVGANDNKDIVTSISGNQVVFDLSSTAKTALSSVASISTAASTALSTANSTGTALTANNTKAQEALDAAKAAKSTAEKANSTASDAKSVADKANSTAAQANSTAGEAKTTAERANNVATQANSTASDAKTVADKANSTATAANSIANTAKNTADAASTAASTAQGAADKAQSTANTASTAAGQAQSAADKAQSTANTASTAASAAQGAADKAQSTANTASTAASTAQGAADKAQGTADAAKQVADTAVQTITVGTDTNHKASGVALTKDNNRLDIVGLKSVTTAVSGNSITVGLTEAAESSIAAVPGIQTSVTDLTSKVGGLTSTVTTIQTDLGTVQQDLGTVKNEWNTVKNSATNSIQSLQIGAGVNSTPITLDKNNTKVNIVGADSNARIVTAVDATNNAITIDLSDAFKKQINNLENTANGSSVTYVTKDGDKVVKIGDTFYPEGRMLDKDGNPVDETGKPATKKDVKPEDIKVTVGDDTARQIGNVASGIDGTAANGKPGADGATPAIRAAEAKIVVGGANGKDGLLGKNGTDLNNVATIKDLQAVAQAGLDFAGDSGEDVHRALSNKLTLQGGVANNATLTDGNIGVITNDTKDGLLIKLNKDIKLGDTGSVKAGATTIDNTGVATNKVTAGNTSLDTNGVITDKVTAGKTSIDTNGISTAKVTTGNTTIDTNGVSAAKVTTGSTTVDTSGISTAQVTITDGAVLSATGMDMKGDAITGLKAGENDTDAVNYSQLKSLENKVSNMGTNSPSKLVDNAGNEVVKIGDQYYPTGTELKDGKTVDNNGAEVQPIDTSKHPISAATNTPNSGLGIQLNESTPAIANGGENGANALVGGMVGEDGTKSGGLLQASGNELGKLATIGDLQVVAQAGLNFVGDTENVTVHRSLSDTLAIKGGIAKAGDLTDNNIGVVANETDGLTVKLAKNIDLGSAGSLKLGEAVSLTPNTGLTIKKDGNTAVYGPEETSITDTEGNKAVTNATGSTLTDVTGNKTVTNAAGSTLTDKDDNSNIINAKGVTVSDKAGNSNSTTATKSEIKDQNGNTNTSTATENKLDDGKGNTNTSTATEIKLVGENGKTNTSTADGVSVEKTVDGKTISNSLTADALTTKGADGKETTVTSKGLTSKDGHKESSITAEGVKAKDGDKETSLTNSGILAKEGDKETTVNAGGLTTNGSVVATDAAGNQTTVNGNGITIAPKEEGKGNVSLTKDGLDNGGNKLKNVAAGTESGDVVNYDQYKELKDKVADMGTSSPAKLVDGEGNEVVKLSDGQYYPVGTELKDGKAIDKEGNEVQPIDTSKTPISAATNTPNSGLGLQVGDDAKAIANDGENGANTLVGGKVGADGTKSGGLLQASGNDLGKVATIGDLQAVAQAGLNFVGDTENVTVHRPLSDTLAIKGGISDLDKLTDDNIGVVASETEGLTVKLAKQIDLGSEGSLNLGEAVSLTPNTGLTIKKDGNTAVYGPEGTNLTDKAGNTTVTSAAGSTLTDVTGNKTVTNAAGSTLTDKDDNSNIINAKGVTVSDKVGNSNSTTATKSEIKDQNGNTNTSTATENKLDDGKGNTNTSTATETKLVGANGNTNSSTADGVTVEKTVDGKTISNSLTADALTTKGADGKEATVTSKGLTSKDGDKESSVTAEGLKAKDGNKETSLTNSGILAKEGDKETTVNAGGLTTNGSVVATDAAGNQTTVNGNGITIDPKEEGKGNVSLTKDGLDNGGNRLQNIGAAEKSGDAVNFNQFKELERKFSAAGGMETVDKDGDKVITIDDKVYKVDDKGNPITADGTRLTEVDGKYYNPSDVTDGKVNEGAKPADSTAQGNTSLSSNAGESGLGLATAPRSADGVDRSPAISSETAKQAIGGNNGQGGLLGSTGRELNKLSTLQDLQAIAVSGLDFGGDTGADVHRPLSTKLSIKGGISDTDNVTDKNIGVVADGSNSLEIKLAKNIDLTADGSLKLGDTVTLDGKDGLTIKGDDGNSANYGGNGLTLTDTNGNSNTLTPKDSTIADNKGNTNTSSATHNTISDGNGNSISNSAEGTTVKDNKGNETNVRADGVVTKDGNGSSASVNPSGVFVVDKEGNTTSVNSDGVLAVDEDGNTTSVNPEGVSSVDKEGNTASMNPDGVAITDKDGNKTTVDANGISLQDKEGNIYVTIDKNGLGGKDGAPIDFKDGINIPGALTVTPETKDANGNTIAPVIDAKGNRIQNVGNGILPTDAANIGQLEQVRSDAKNHSNNVGSMTAALAALNPLPYMGGEKGQIMAGVGVYENKQAVALGYAYTPNNDQQYTLGVSYGEGGKTMANMGATFRIGAGDFSVNQGKSTQVKELQQTVSDLQSRNAQLTNDVEELKQLVQEMRQSMNGTK